MKITPTLEEFVAYAKEHPGEIVIGETGTGAAPPPWLLPPWKTLLALTCPT